MKLNVKDIEFLHRIADPHQPRDASSAFVQRLRYGQPHQYEIEDSAGFLYIKGHKRTVAVGKANVAFMIVDDEPVVEAKGGKR